MERIFNLWNFKPPKKHLTISARVSLGKAGVTVLTCFSLGGNTDISAETYENPLLYIGMDRSGRFQYKGSLLSECRKLDILYVPRGTLCGMAAGEEGFVYLEIFMRKDTVMTNLLKAGQVMRLKDLISYEEGSIANLDIARNETMKFVLMAFDEGCSLSPHKAPGDAIVFALEGKAVIGYEGENFTVSEGECFRFDKNGLHSVSASGKFKMALLLVTD